MLHFTANYCNIDSANGYSYTSSMLKLSQSFVNKPIVSLQTGAPVGLTMAPIINPDNLKIEGFYAEDRFDKQTKILLIQDIRDILPQGLVVNDHHALTEVDELVRLKNLIDLGFELTHKPVYTADKVRVGKVDDYAIDSQSFFVQKIYVNRSIIKSFGAGQIGVDRNDIIEVTDKKIVIQDIVRKAKATDGAPSPVPAT